MCDLKAGEIYKILIVALYEICTVLLRRKGFVVCILINVEAVSRFGEFHGIFQRTRNNLILYKRLNHQAHGGIDSESI